MDYDHAPVALARRCDEPGQWQTWQIVMPEHGKLLERVLVGLVVCVISINLLTTELPRVMPYLAVLVVIFVVVRLVLFYTRE